MGAHPLGKLSATGASLAVLASRAFSSSSTPACLAAASTARAGQPCPAFSGYDSTGAIWAAIGRAGERDGRAIEAAPCCCARPAGLARPAALQHCLPSTASTAEFVGVHRLGPGAALARSPFRGTWFCAPAALPPYLSGVQAVVSLLHPRQHACMPPGSLPPPPPPPAAAHACLCLPAAAATPTHLHLSPRPSRRLLDSMLHTPESAVQPVRCIAEGDLVVSAADRWPAMVKAPFEEAPAQLPS